MVELHAIFLLGLQHLQLVLEHLDVPVVGEVLSTHLEHELRVATIKNVAAVRVASAGAHEAQLIRKVRSEVVGAVSSSRIPYY